MKWSGPTSRLSSGARAGWITAELVWFMGSARRRDDPYAVYDRLRRLDRTHRSPFGVWIVSGHAEVNQLLRDPRMSSRDNHIDLDTLHLGPLRRLLGRTGVTETGAFFERGQDLLLFLDPPDHTRIRGQVGRVFTPRRVQDLEPRIQAIADELLGSLETVGSCEFLSAFAYPFPARVICELIGVPTDEIDRIIDHAPALAGGLEPGPLLTVEARDAANLAMTALVDYLEGLIERRKSDPDEGLLSALLHTEDHERLTDDELVSLILLLLIAGHETTANLLGNALVALHDQPQRAAELCADPALDDPAIDELLRFDSPVQLTMRFATEAVTLAGATIEAGSAVVLCLGAANHDDRVFSRPDQLDWHRHANPHLAFGGGIHHCLGARLARTEARIGLRTVLDRLGVPQVESTPTRRSSFTIRGLERLDLTWDPKESGAHGP